jgi:hypothetical protein
VAACARCKGEGQLKVSTSVAKQEMNTTVNLKDLLVLYIVSSRVLEYYKVPSTMVADHMIRNT